MERKYRSSGTSVSGLILYLDPASARAYMAQALDLYSDIKNIGNHNKDSTLNFISFTNQYLILCVRDQLHDLSRNIKKIGVKRLEMIELIS